MSQGQELPSSTPGHPIYLLPPNIAKPVSRVQCSVHLLLRATDAQKLAKKQRRPQAMCPLSLTFKLKPSPSPGPDQTQTEKRVNSQSDAYLVQLRKKQPKAFSSDHLRGSRPVLSCENGRVGVLSENGRPGVIVGRTKSIIDSSIFHTKGQTVSTTPLRCIGMVVIDAMRQWHLASRHSLV